MKTEQKIVMYDSPEAAQLKTMQVWVSGPDEHGRSYLCQTEDQARYSGCTHKKCECGAAVKKGWVKCEECRYKHQENSYLKMPYVSWDGIKPVVTAYGDDYFFNDSDLCEYMEEHELTEVELIICEPIGYKQLEVEHISGDECHEDFEPPKELVKRVNELNEFIKTLKPHSWQPGKFRTSYKLPPEANDQ